MSMTSISLVAGQYDGWGIPGRTFIQWYVGGSVAAVIVALLLRPLIFRGRATVEPDTLDPEQIAFLVSGPERTVFTALAGLRWRGLVAAAGRGSIIAVPGHSSGLSRLQQDILQITGSGEQTRTLQSQLRLGPAMAEIEDRLRQDGLIVNKNQVRVAHGLKLLIFAVQMVGFLRDLTVAPDWRDLNPNEGAFANLAHGNPFLVMVVLIFALVLVPGPPRITGAGRKAVRYLKNRHGYLTSSEPRAWLTNGAVGAGLAVALFGSSGMSKVDPEFAGEVRV